MLPYYVHVPPGRFGSAGMRALQVLAQQLHALTLPDAPSKEAIVIYPEIVHGNPCHAERVVRWILNTPGLLGGPTAFLEQDLLFTWDRRYLNLPDDRVLKVDVIERELFRSTPDMALDRTVDCLWIGKGKFTGDVAKRHPDLVQITREWPPSREELAALLQHTRTLYSYDHNSMLLQEAALCGVKVVLLPDGIVPLLPILPSEMEYQDMLNNFMHVTQLHFGGDIHALDTLLQFNPIF